MEQNFTAFHSVNSNASEIALSSNLQSEKIEFDTMVDEQVNYNLRHYGFHFYANSKPYAQTTKGEVCNIEPFWNHAISFETQIAEISNLCYEASRTEVNQSEYVSKLRDRLTFAIKHLIDILLAHNGNNVTEVKKLLLSSYVAGVTSERMYVSTTTVNLARLLIAQSVFTKQHQGPLFFTLFRRLSNEINFSLQWLGLEHFKIMDK